MANLSDINDLETIEAGYELLRMFGVQEETLKCMTDIHGLNMQTLNDVCSWKFGLRDCRELLFADDLYGEGVD